MIDVCASCQRVCVLSVYVCIIDIQITFIAATPLLYFRIYACIALN